jgi:hypothetical protein
MRGVARRRSDIRVPGTAWIMMRPSPGQVSMIVGDKIQLLLSHNLFA